MSNIVVIIDKGIRKLLTLWRECVFRKTVKKAGVGLHVYGELHLVNKNIVVGDNVRIYPGVQFFGDGLIKIGNNVSIGNNVMVYASAKGGVQIGDNTIIAAQSYIVDMNHGIAKDRLIREQEISAESINIGNAVWLGANVTVLKGVSIGEGAVVGAKSLVNKNIEPYSVVAGVPCRLINRRE